MKESKLIPRELLDDFFSGRSLSQEDLEQVLAYRDECVWYALNQNLQMDTPYGSEFDRLVKIHKVNLNGQRVIELGPGGAPKAKVLLERWGAREYVGVEPFFIDMTRRRLGLEDERITLIKTDGLTYLLSQPDNSAVVINCGVICPELIRGWFGPYNMDYYRFLGREIFRVTPYGAATVSITNRTGEERDLFFRDHGFKGTDSIAIYTKPLPNPVLALPDKSLDA